MAVDMFLKLDGIKGESADRFHKDWIEIESFSWGATNTGSHSGGGGGGAGKVSMNDLSFTQVMSKASPKLMEYCANGKHLKQATLAVRKAGGQQQDYLTYKLTDVLVSSYQTEASSQVPVDTASLNFRSASVSYTGPSGETVGADCAGTGQ